MQRQSNSVIRASVGRISPAEFFRRYNILLVFALIVILSTIVTGGTFIQAGNLANVAERASIVGIIAIGQTLVILTGGIDLSIAAIMTVTYVLQAIFSLAGMSQGVAAISAMAVAVGIGCMNGIIISKTKVAPFIVTLCVMMICDSLMLIITRTRAMRYVEFQKFINGLFNINTETARFLPAAVLLISVVVVALLMSRTKMGTSITAVGGNLRAAFLSGVKADKYIILVYALSGLFAALAALTLAFRVPGLNPNSSAPYQMESIAAVVIGGTSTAGGEGSVIRTLFGAIVIATMFNLMNLLMIDPFLQYTVKGAILILVVANTTVFSKR